MTTNLALIDLISPYVLRGQDIGTWRPVLAVMFVDRHETFVDDAGVVIEGVVRFSPSSLPFFDPKNAVLGSTPFADPKPTGPVATEAVHPADDPARRDPWIDINDAHIDFRFVAQRRASGIVATGVAGLGTPSAAFAPTATVLTALDAAPVPVDPAAAPSLSDYPSTAFTLDLLLTTAVLRPPMLHGAKLAADGVLVPDPANDKVTLSLPRLKLRLSQGSSVGNPLTLDLLSAGASNLDDPADIGSIEAIRMNPPYAFIGTSNVVGFGFRSAVLDLSDGVTPAAVLEKFGFDESWQGVYLPEVRLFVAPHGLRDLAVDAGARDLLIGIGQHAGVSGDFDLEVIEQGSGDLRISARFLSADGHTITSSPLGAGDAMAWVPALTTMIIDVAGGREPYRYTVTIGADTFTDQTVIPLNLSDAPAGRGYAAVIKIVVTDQRPDATPSKLDVTAIRQDSPSLPPAPADGPVPPPTVRTDKIELDGKPITEPVLRIVGQDETTVTVSLDPPDPLTTWFVDGIKITGSSPTNESPTITVPLGRGESKDVVGQRRSFSGGQVLDCYFAQGRPYPDEGGSTAADNGYARDPRNTHTTPAVDGEPADAWTPGGYPVRDAYAPLLDHLTGTEPILITGSTSPDEDNQSGPYLDTLADRRARGFKALLDEQYAGKLVFTISATPAPPDPGGPRNHRWKATATLPKSQDTAGTVGTRTSGKVARAAEGDPLPEPKVEGKDNTGATKPATPSWFRSAGVKVRIVRDTFVACEVFGKIHYRTAVQQALAKGDSKNVLKDVEPVDLAPLGSNPADGLVDFRVLVNIDPASGAVTVVGQAGADPADKDGLFLTGARPGQPPVADNLGRDVLGLFALFTPLLAESAPPNPATGDVAALVISTLVTTLPFDLALLHLMKVERVVVYGGELTVRSRPSGPEVSLLLDVEVAISASIKKGEGKDALVLLEIPPDSPLVVRYKAIGLRLGYTPPEKRFQFRPVFDSAKGYTIDVSKPGAIKATEPLGKILQVLSSRLARTNPLTLDVDLGLKIDLGVVSVDRLGVRVPLDGKGLPQLSALGAGVDIPNILKGKGYLEIHDTGFSGGLDLTIVPVKLRVAAALRLEHIPAQPATGTEPGHPEATAVIAAIEVDFPVAIPLASSGLGIFGFLGLFAMHFARDESIIQAGTTTTPALAWLKETGGDPSNLKKWKPQLDSWAFGVGALLGSMEGGTLISLKGMLLLELPGPRILLFVKAKMLSPKPELKSTAEGNLLAVLDIDTQRGTLTIGIIADYTVNPIVKLHIPVEAFFNFKDGQDWHLFLGRYDGPVQATILEVFDGSAYLMISGKGIEEHKGLPKVDGFAVALGVHAVISWGVVSSGLYLKVTADVDVVVGFTPFRLAGVLRLQGELRLFVVSIGASAQLALDIAHKQIPATGGAPAHEATVYVIKGEVCGELDLFFFTIKGCVHFELTGGDSPPAPEPPPLVNSLTLVSRSPALVVGTATDRGVDSGLGDSVEFEGTWIDPAPQAPGAEPDGQRRMPVVPVDAMPVLVLSAPPVTDDPAPFADPHQPTALRFAGQIPGGAPSPKDNGLVARGDDWFRYDLKSVELIGPVSAGPTPATWWTLRPPLEGNQNAALALLSWVPTPAPKAVERSEALTSTVTERWGTVCVPAAPPATVVYSFRQQPLGPSAVGWVLYGTAWPDPVGTQRSAPPATTMAARERWRCGNGIIDNGRGIIPATVIGQGIPCPQPAPKPGPNDPSSTLAGPAAPPAPIIAPVPVIPGVADVLTAAALGQPVSRTDVLTMVLGPAALTSTGPCESRLLLAPVFDGTGTPIVTGYDSAVLAGIFDELGYTPSPLLAAVELRTGGIGRMRILLLVREEVLRYGPHAVARALDASGTEVGYVPGRTISKNEFPAEWLDPDGPARTELDSVLSHGNLDPRLAGLRMVLIELADLPGADRIEIGVENQAIPPMTAPPFGIAMLDLLGTSETDRFQWDTTTLLNDQDVLSKALGKDSGTAALLRPDTVYRVKTTWTAIAAKRIRNAPDGADAASVFDHVTPRYQDQPGNTLPTVTQTFWFRTDSTFPRHLDSWVLATTPCDGESHVFGLEPMRMAFATTDVLRMYSEYGKKLQVRLRAASFRTPAAGSANPPHPFPLDAANPYAALTETPGAVLSPWEETVTTVLGQDSCVAVDGERSRHLTAEIPIPLDPFTEYVMDVEAVDKAPSPTSTPAVVLRRTFNTSAFGTVQGYAAALLASRVRHRSVPANAFTKIAQLFAFLDPAGAQLDEELRAIGIEPLPVPASPGAVVFWHQPSGSAAPEPAAVLVDGTEALWRTRPMPGRDPHPDPNGVDQWLLTEQEWLSLVIGTGNSAPAQRIVRAPGLQRAVVLLNPGGRGKRLRLSLHRSPFTLDLLNGPGATDLLVPAVDVTFTRAPWED